MTAENGHEQTGPDHVPDAAGHVPHDGSAMSDLDALRGEFGDEIERVRGLPLAERAAAFEQLHARLAESIDGGA